MHALLNIDIFWTVSTVGANGVLIGWCTLDLIPGSISVTEPLPCLSANEMAAPFSRHRFHPEGARPRRLLGRQYYCVHLSGRDAWELVDVCHVAVLNWWHCFCQISFCATVSAILISCTIKVRSQKQIHFQTLKSPASSKISKMSSKRQSQKSPTQQNVFKVREEVKCTIHVHTKHCHHPHQIALTLWRFFFHTQPGITTFSYHPVGTF